MPATRAHRRHESKRSRDRRPSPRRSPCPVPSLRLSTSRPMCRVARRSPRAQPRRILFRPTERHRRPRPSKTRVVQLQRWTHNGCRRHSPHILRPKIWIRWSSRNWQIRSVSRWTPQQKSRPQPLQTQILSVSRWAPPRRAKPQPPRTQILSVSRLAPLRMPKPQKPQLKLTLSIRLAWLLPHRQLLKPCVMQPLRTQILSVSRWALPRKSRPQPPRPQILLVSRLAPLQMPKPLLKLTISIRLARLLPHRQSLKP